MPSGEVKEYKMLLDIHDLIQRLKDATDAEDVSIYTTDKTLSFRFQWYGCRYKYTFSILDLAQSNYPIDSYVHQIARSANAALKEYRSA